jgi:hypothetical protein
VSRRGRLGAYRLPLRGDRPTRTGSGDIGRERDRVLALREWRQFELTLNWSRFEPGATINF